MWLSNPADYNNFYIGLSFPNADFVESLRLSAKERKTEIAKQNKETLPPEQIFSTEDKAQLDKYLNASLVPVEQSYSQRPFSSEPTQAWYWSDELPKQEEGMITITNNYILVSQACVKVLKQFRIGNNRFIPLPLYEYGSKELLSNELWYLLELSDWRSFFIPEKSSPNCKPVNPFDKKGYQNHKILNHYEETDAYAMSKESDDCDLDLWHEPQVNKSICVSDALKTKQGWQMHGVFSRVSWFSDWVFSY